MSAKQPEGRVTGIIFAATVIMTAGIALASITTNARDIAKLDERMTKHENDDLRAAEIMGGMNEKVKYIYDRVKSWDDAGTNPKQNH